MHISLPLTCGVSCVARMGDEGMMRIGRRCFVGNLAWSTSWQDLKDVFKEAGTVVYANVVRDGNGQGKGVVFFCCACIRR